MQKRLCKQFSHFPYRKFPLTFPSIDISLGRRETERLKNVKQKGNQTGVENLTAFLIFFSSLDNSAQGKETKGKQKV